MKSLEEEVVEMSKMVDGLNKVERLCSKNLMFCVHLRSNIRLHLNLEERDLTDLKDISLEMFQGQIAGAGGYLSFLSEIMQDIEFATQKL